MSCRSMPLIFGAENNEITSQEFFCDGISRFVVIKWTTLPDPKKTAIKLIQSPLELIFD